MNGRPINHQPGKNKTTRIWAITALLALASLYGVVSKTRATLSTPSDSLLTEPLTVTIDRQHRLSLHGVNVPTEAVLEAIADAADLDLHIVGTFSKNVSFNVQSQPVLKTLLRVLRDQNFVSRHIFTRYDKSGQRVIRPGQLWVYSFESSHGFAPLDEGSLWNPDASDGQSESLATLQQPADVETVENPISGIEGALQKGDELALERNIQFLLDIQGEQGVNTLLLMAQKLDAEKREEIADALSDIENDSKISALDRMIGDEAANVREAVILALGEIGDDQAAQVLAGALRDPDPDLREKVIDTLGDIGTPTAAELLQEALSDPEPDIREAAQTYLEDLASDGEEDY